MRRTPVPARRLHYLSAAARCSPPENAFVRSGRTRVRLLPSRLEYVIAKGAAVWATHLTRRPELPRDSSTQLVLWVATLPRPWD